MEQRLQALSVWCAAQLNAPAITLTTVSGDASFRRYFRFSHAGQSYIAMDAPPEKEDSSSFVAIARHWFSAGVRVPEIIADDLNKGFLLLSDFGDALLLPALMTSGAPDVASGEQLYSLAMQALLQIQALDAPVDYALPPYDRTLLRREMSLFTDWLLGDLLAIALDQSEQAMFAELFECLEDGALQQDQVCVHRDFHSRNLMLLEPSAQGGVEMGVIDFQDAVRGPITYDLVSLLRDCYITWPDDVVTDWCQSYYQLAREQGLTQCSATTFKRWFDLMGLQRHLKAAGIFARLSLRDGKHGYLDDIPCTVSYLVKVSANYSETRQFSEWLQGRMLPALEQWQAAR